MNISILSLSISSFFSSSPLITRHQSFISKSSFNKYYFPILFLNFQKFTIDKTIFTHGIDKFLYYQADDSITEYSDLLFNQDNHTAITLNMSDAHLLIIHDCTFISITDSENSEYKGFFIID